MKIYIGADHRGYQLKEKLKAELVPHEVIDLGASSLNPQDDFVDFAKVVGEKVAQDNTSRGILLCGSGAGMCIAANKLTGIRCAVGHTAEEVEAARHDDDINVLALSADFVDSDEANILIKAFLTTEFAPEERFVRRIDKIRELESHA